MAKSNEIKDLETLLSESNIDAEIKSILEELGVDETAEKTGEVAETSPLKDTVTDGSVLDQDPSTKDAIESGLDEPGVAGDKEVVIPDEDKKVDVVITVEKDKEPSVDAAVDATVDKLSAELNQTELGESFTNIYNILSDNINDIDEKSFEADYEGYKDDGKECISSDQEEHKACEEDYLKDATIKTDVEASKLNEEETAENVKLNEDEKDDEINALKDRLDKYEDKEKQKKGTKEKIKKAASKADSILSPIADGGVALGTGAVAGYFGNKAAKYKGQKAENEKLVTDTKTARDTNDKVSKDLEQSKLEKTASEKDLEDANKAVEEAKAKYDSAVEKEDIAKASSELEKAKANQTEKAEALKTNSAAVDKLTKDAERAAMEADKYKNVNLDSLDAQNAALDNSIIKNSVGSGLAAGMSALSTAAMIKNIVKAHKKKKEEIDESATLDESKDTRKSLQSDIEQLDAEINKAQDDETKKKLIDKREGYKNSLKEIRDSDKKKIENDKLGRIATSAATGAAALGLAVPSAYGLKDAIKTNDFGTGAASLAGGLGSGLMAGLSAYNAIKAHQKKKEEDQVESEEKTKTNESVELSESTAIEVLKDLIDVHGDGNTLIIAKKGELDKPGAALIKIKISKEQYNALEPEFHEEETLPVVTESQVALMIARENNDRLFSELVEATALANRLQNAICEKYSDLAKDRAASLNEEINVWNDKLEDKEDIPAQPLIEERYVTLDDLCEILDESGYEVNEESLANLIADIIDEEVIFEASTAERNSYRLGDKGNKIYSDLVIGKAIARIEDKKDRDAAVAANKAGGYAAVEPFIGDGKEDKAERATEEKFKKMQDAGYYAEKEEIEGDRPEKVEDKEKASIKEEVKNVRKAKTASEVNNFYTTDFSEKKDVCDKECEDKEHCDCFTVTKDVDNHEDVELKDSTDNSPEEAKVGADESDWFDKDETVDVKEVIVESEEFNAVAKEFLEENDYEVDDENISLIKEAFINGTLSELDENLTEGFLAGKAYAKKAAALTASINKKRETEKDATKELAKLDKVVSKARAAGIPIDYADVDGRISLSML